MTYKDLKLQFQTMDALRRLEFSDATFDLVNQRLGVSWVRKWDWRNLFLEYLRVTRAGGIIRISEAGSIESNSSALTRICAIALSANYHAGRLFAPEGDGLTGQLERLMRTHAIEEVQSQVHTLVYRAGTEAGQAFYQDMGDALAQGGAGVSLPGFGGLGPITSSFLYHWHKKEEVKFQGVSP